MSRTLHHIGYQHWNIRRDEVYNWVAWQRKLVNLEVINVQVGCELYDLRFYAGCKRVPQEIHKKRVKNAGYMRTWGHAGGVARGLAKGYSGRRRMEERVFSRDVVKTWRGSGNVAHMVEPEGRTRHSALWDAW